MGLDEAIQGVKGRKPRTEPPVASVLNWEDEEHLLWEAENEGSGIDEDNPKRSKVNKESFRGG